MPRRLRTLYLPLQGRVKRKAPSFSRRDCAQVLQKVLRTAPKKGGGAPTGAPSIVRATLSDVAASKCFGRGRVLIGDRSPFGAPPRRLPRKLMPWLSPGRVSWDVRAAGVSRRALSQSSEAPRRPVIMPADAMPGPPGAGLQAPPAGTALAPSLGCHRSTPLDARDSLHVSEIETSVKRIVSISVTSP